MIFAVATIDQVIIYDTSSIIPMAILKSIHYDCINDLTWMSSNILMAASSDGFCSFTQIQHQLTGDILEQGHTDIPDDISEHYNAFLNVNF